MPPADCLTYGRKARSALDIDLTARPQSLRGTGIRHALRTCQDDPSPITVPTLGQPCPTHQLGPLIG